MKSSDDLASRRARVQRLAAGRPASAEPAPPELEIVRRAPSPERRARLLRLLVALLDTPDAPGQGRPG